MLLILNFFFFCFRVHYNVILKGIDVDGEPVDLPPSIASFGGNGGTIIDSGTTLAYLPENLYTSLLEKVKLFPHFFFVLLSNHDPHMDVFS